MFLQQKGALLQQRHQERRTIIARILFDNTQYR